MVDGSPEPSVPQGPSSPHALLSPPSAQALGIVGLVIQIFSGVFMLGWPTVVLQYDHPHLQLLGPECQDPMFTNAVGARQFMQSCNLLSATAAALRQRILWVPSTLSIAPLQNMDISIGTADLINSLTSQAVQASLYPCPACPLPLSCAVGLFLHRKKKTDIEKTRI